MPKYIVATLKKQVRVIQPDESNVSAHLLGTIANLDINPVELALTRSSGFDIENPHEAMLIAMPLGAPDIEFNVSTHTRVEPYTIELGEQIQPELGEKIQQMQKRIENICNMKRDDVKGFMSRLKNRV
jgi:hypothetical protein